MKIPTTPLLRIARQSKNGRRTSFKHLEEMNKAGHEAKEQPAPEAAFTENEF